MLIQSKMQVPSEVVIAMGQKFAEKDALNAYIIIKLEREKTELEKKLQQEIELVQKLEEKKALFKEGDALNLSLITKLEKIIKETRDENLALVAVLKKAEAKIQEREAKIQEQAAKIQEQAAKIQEQAARIRKLLPGVAWVDS